MCAQSVRVLDVFDLLLSEKVHPSAVCMFIYLVLSLKVPVVMGLPFLQIGTREDLFVSIGFRDWLLGWTCQIFLGT